MSASHKQINALLPIAAAGALIAGSGCASHKAAAPAVAASVQATADFTSGVIASEPHTAQATAPKAVAYRMSGPYADHVAIALNPDGTLLSYPAPTDLGASSSPVPLAGGWYLSRCGITPGSVFTRYTIDEYRALPSAPTPKELLADVIPGAKVTDFRTLPLTVAEALADTARVSALLQQPPSPSPQPLK